MMDVATFVAKNYYDDDTLDSVNRINTMLAHPGIYFAGSVADNLVLLYMAISDEALAILKKADTEEAFTRDLSERMAAMPGDNIYVFRLVTEGTPALRLLKELRKQIIIKHKAKTFSWHDNDRIMLYTYEVPHV